jgi:hypothetical protein
MKLHSELGGKGEVPPKKARPVNWYRFKVTNSSAIEVYEVYVVLNN